MVWDTYDNKQHLSLSLFYKTTLKKCLQLAPLIQYSICSTRNNSLTTCFLVVFPLSFSLMSQVIAYSDDATCPPFLDPTQSQALH